MQRSKERMDNASGSVNRHPTRQSRILTVTFSTLARRLLCFHVVATMTYQFLKFVILSSALSGHYFVHCYAPGGLMWHRDHETFIPIANVSSFEAHRYQQIYVEKIRSLENHDFQGEIVRLGYFQDDNMVNFYDNDTKISGACGEIWNMLADHLNFTLVVMKTDGFGGRVLHKNNTFYGILGLIKRHEIDVVPRVGFCDPFTVVMNFTTPIWKDRYRFYIRPVWKTDGTWMLHMFTREVWLFIFTLALLLSVIGYLVQKKSIDVLGDMTIYPHLHDYFFHAYAALCGQHYTPEALDKRNKIIGLSRSLFAWLLLMVLSSNLISWLTNRHFEAPFKDVESLLNHTKYDVVVDNGSMVFFPFKRKLRELTGTKMGSLRDPGGKYQDRLRIVTSREELYRQGCWAEDENSIFESEDTYRAAGRFFCNLVAAGKSYINTWITFGVIDSFKYKRTFDIGILKLKQFGLINGMKERWMKSTTDGASPMTKPVASVNFQQVWMLFAVLCLGMVASLAILILETIVFTFESNQRRNFGGTR